MNDVLEDILMHYGMPRRSGRYPWGSGENPYQHSGDFLSRVDELRAQNFTYTDEDGKLYSGDMAIAKSMGLSTTQFRVQLSLANDERRAILVETARGLREKGYSLQEIAEKMGFNNDSSVRTLLNDDSERRMNQARKTAEFLKQQVDEKGMIEVGSGVEKELGISKEKMREALYILEFEGYPTYSGGVPQATNPGKQTTITVLCPPGSPHKDIYNYDEIHSVNNYISYDEGETFKKAFEYPSSMDSSRMQIRYGDEGGKEKDGIIEIRRGVKDLDLGEAHYAQVRILVDGTHYLKGMAVYSDDLPPGVDVVFNTNKKSGTPALGPKDNTVLKPIKNDPDNPFGSLIKEHGGQSYYDDPNGKYVDEKTGKNQSLSLINKRAEEGDWGDWSDTLPAQFLSKQPKELIEKQLNLTIADKVAEYEEICALTNPTVKKNLLKSFSDDCDAAAVHLKAASLPRQKYKVIIPVTALKDTEVYAPDYENGEKVALVRYPHGGTFEIPILTVNNKQPDAKNMLANATDAVGINSKVAERLSGADFDGDTVMVIPCNTSGSKVKIASKPPLKELEGFDPKMEYGGKPEGTFKKMTNTQKEMGVISNLITDMTIKGASEEELARAVKHSMVVIDAEKHGLDYKQSERDNGIAALKKKYQGHYDENGKYHEGASTLISRAKSQTSITKRQGSPKIDPDTGKLIYKETDKINSKTGKKLTQKSTKMEDTDDAFTLVSEYRAPAEILYARYANKTKALANQARLEILSSGNIKYSASAKETYKKEVDHLKAQLNVSLMNAPRERQAQLIANSKVNAIKKEHPEMSKSEIKKISQQAIVEARIKAGADGKGTKIKISEKEWEAIQAGAISENTLNQILRYSDPDEIRKYATPRTSIALSDAKKAKISAMSNSGYTISEIAKSLGVSTSTVSKYLNKKEVN